MFYMFYFYMFTYKIKRYKSIVNNYWKMQFHSLISVKTSFLGRSLLIWSSRGPSHLRGGPIIYTSILFSHP